MKPIEVFIIDDSQIHLEGLKLILRAYDTIKITGEANSIQEALTNIQQIRIPDIILLDISLEKEMDGIEAIPVIRQKYSDTKIMILTHYKDAKFLIKSLQAGASAYLAKDIKPEELVHAILSVNEGNGVYLGDTLSLSTLLEAFGTEDNIVKNKTHNLTVREVEIINLLAQGYSTKEIATKLDIESNTVESHKERIKEKLKVKTVIQMVVQSLKKGIIQLD